MGPYLSERQWGTVREDYSENGDAWDYFTHDHARSRAYHWGEDGIAGLSDDKQRLCFSLALWNGKDPILKGICSTGLNDGFPVEDCENCPIRILSSSRCGSDDGSNAGEQVGTPC